MCIYKIIQIKQIVEQKSAGKPKWCDDPPIYGIFLGNTIDLKEEISYGVLGPPSDTFFFTNSIPI